MSFHGIRRSGAAVVVTHLSRDAKRNATRRNLGELRSFASPFPTPVASLE